MPQCTYIPVISAEFAKTITDAEIDHEFQEIERVFQCLEEQIGTHTLDEETVYDHGLIDNSYVIDPGLGVIHYMEIEGDTNITIDEPEEEDPKIITLIIANRGTVEAGNYGKFNFKQGTVWSNDRDAPMDGKPWNMYANLDGTETGTLYPGFYGCAVQCFYDGAGWVHIVWARHHLDIFGVFNPDDIYDWR